MTDPQPNPKPNEPKPARRATLAEQRSMMDAYLHACGIDAAEYASLPTSELRDIILHLQKKD